MFLAWFKNSKLSGSFIIESLCFQAKLGSHAGNSSDIPNKAEFLEQ